MRLGTGDARQLRDQSQLAHHHEALPQGADVAEIAARDDYPIRHLPVELLHQLDADGLLPLDAQGIHRIGKVNAVAGTDFLHEGHAAVEVCIQRQRQGAVGDGLNQLGVGYLALGEENDGLQPGDGAVGSQRRGGVAG